MLDFSSEAQRARIKKRWGDPEIRFWNRVDKTPGHGPKGECWLWLGALQGNKLYGVCRSPIDGKQTTAHRVAFYFENDYIDEDLLVCHECDFGLCVNPKHLWQGTVQDNVTDKCKKGRARTNVSMRLRDKCGKYMKENLKGGELGSTETGNSIPDSWAGHDASTNSSNLHFTVTDEEQAWIDAANKETLRQLEEAEKEVDKAK